LTLATGVIVWHSFPLTGRHVPYAPAHQFLSDVWVDGFFAISGFLITASWLSNPRLRNYFVARGLRILPGLWVCLIVTAFVVAPIGVAIQGRPAAKLLLSSAPIQYALKNSAVSWLQPDVGGKTAGATMDENRRESARISGDVESFRVANTTAGQCFTAITETQREPRKANPLAAGSSAHHAPRRGHYFVRVN
jgi:hypothetical protein